MNYSRGFYNDSKYMNPYNSFPFYGNMQMPVRGMASMDNRSNTSSTPFIPDSYMPTISNIPMPDGDMPALPSIPSIPNDTMPTYPTTSDMNNGNMPTYPTMPDMNNGNMPAYPNMPHMNNGNMPAYPSMPTMPGMPMNCQQLLEYMHRMNCMENMYNMPMDIE